jgi:peptide/nickel transport system substrate-binding protein
MLRGFRWQFLALIISVALFAISFASRPDETNPPVITATAAPSATPLPVATALPVAAGIATPIPAAADTTIIGYREGLVGSVQRLNPLLAALNPVDADITSLIFEGLTGINSHGEIEGRLALEWVGSFDGLEYVFVLRDDILWQDGVPFTAADVVYTMSLLSSPDFPGLPQLGAFWRTVETQQIDDYHVRFRLAQPLATFPEMLRIGIVPYHVLQGTTADQLATHPFNLTPIGTGPYQLEALRAADNKIRIVDLRAAPVYQQRSQSYEIERFSFHLYDSFDQLASALYSAEIDGYASASRSERQALLNLQGVVNIHSTYAPATGILIFNWVNEDFPVFREQRVRQALATGLQRSSLVERHLFNAAVVADSPFLPLSWSYDYDAYEIMWPNYDPAAAIEVLDRAQIPDKPEGDESTTLFNFTIMTIDDPALTSMAEEIAVQWRLLNLGVSVESVNAEIYQARLESAQFDVALVELSKRGSADPDVYSFWHQGQYPDGQNYGGVDDRAISEALERARRDVNGTNRSIHYHNFQSEFVDKAIAIPLYYPLYSYAVNVNVTGIQLGFIGSPADRFVTLVDWRVQ